MIIRCPQCSHSRSISESKIPPTAELATCPKCKRRFRFRTLPIRLDEPPAAAPATDKRTERPAQENTYPAQEVLRPQSAFREAAGKEDIWDAVEALNHRWQKQMDQHVVTVSTPVPADETQSVPSDATEPPARPAAPQAPSTPADPVPSPPAPAVPVGVSAAPAVEPRNVPFASPAVEPRNVPFASPVAEPQALPPLPTEQEPEMPLAAPVAPLTSAEQAPAEKTPARRRVPFIYSQDGPPPEERVENDLQMLQASSGERPTRDLGRLREFPDLEAESGGAGTTDVDPDTAAFEEPSRFGLFKSFFATIKSVMFQGPDFFSRLDGTGSLAYSYLFLLAIGYICLLSVFVWSLAATHLFALPALINPGTLPAALLLTPPALGGVVLFLTAATRLVLLVCAPDKADFGTVFKILCYAAAPFILGVVPVVGVPLGAAWSLAALATGCRYGLRTSWPLAVCAPLPPALCVQACAVFIFM